MLASGLAFYEQVKLSVASHNKIIKPGFGPKWEKALVKITPLEALENLILNAFPNNVVNEIFTS